MTERAQHTPGPWEYVPVERDDEVVYSIASDRPREGGRSITGVGEAWSEDDARLIAATPDLLEAARIALEFFRHSHTDGTTPFDSYDRNGIENCETCRAGRIIKGAIRKAEER